MLKLLVGLLILSVGFKPAIAGYENGLWVGAFESPEFLAELQKNGIASFHGTWKLVQSEGLECSPVLTISSSAANQMEIKSTSSFPRPNFTIPGINTGVNERRGITETHWSNSVWDKSRILSLMSITGIAAMTKLRAERELRLFADGMLVVNVSENRMGANEYYRCVYQR